MKKQTKLCATDLPAEPPEGLVEWAIKNHLSNLHAMVYRTGWYANPLTETEEPCVDTRCSACGRPSKLDKLHIGCRHSYASAPFGFFGYAGDQVISGDSTLCPVCGTEVEAIYSGRINDYLLLGDITVLSVAAIQGRLVLLYWYVAKYVNEAGREYVEVKPRRAFAVESGKINCFSYHNALADCYRYKDTAGKLAAVFPWEKEILYGTTAENSAFDRYMECKGDLYPVSYLRLWVDRPRVENLMVQGAGHLVREMIQRDCNPHTYSYNGEVNIPKLKEVLWREKRPAQMLGLNKDVFRIMVAQRWTIAEWQAYLAICQRGEKVNAMCDVLDIRKLGQDHAEKLLRADPIFSVTRSVRYLLKQKKRDAVTLLDYWNLVQQNGGDLSIASVRYPQNLKTAHDHESARQRYLENEGYTEQFAKRTEELCCYSWESDGLMIRPVASAEELYQEGKILSHCVYSYLKRHVFGETAIMLIRRSDKPDEPYFTLELNEKTMTVRQNRGRCNCARTDEISAFEDQWLKWALLQKIKKEVKTA